MRTSVKRKRSTTDRDLPQPFFKKAGSEFFSVSNSQTSSFFNSNALHRKPLDTAKDNSGHVSKSKGRLSHGKEIETQLQQSRSDGKPLDPNIKKTMERKFNTNFADVKIHNDQSARAMSTMLNAKAFTYENHIYFNEGQYNPGTKNGNKLLAHELTHVQQQSENRTNNIQRNIFDDIYDWIRKIYDTGTLWLEIQKRLKSSSIKVNEIVGIIKRATYSVRKTLYNFEGARNEIIKTLSGEDLVKVMSALLSGDIYRPGWESEGYHMLPTAEKESLNKKIDDQFVKETGITRSLNPSLSKDMPLVRKWLRIRDHLYTTMVDKKMEEENYEFYLTEAIDLLKEVEFNSKLNFITEGDETEIDIPGLSYWKLVRDPEMSVRSGDKTAAMLYFTGAPSEAWKGVDELFDNRNSWAFDCAEFVQAAHMYARRHTFGEDKFAEMVKTKGGGKLYLRMHYSTGFNAEKMYQRTTKGGDITEITRKTSKKTSLSMDQVLADAPIGSRVVWRNIKAKGTFYYNENAIKLGPDLFAAHGFTDQQKFTRSELEMALAKITNKSADEKYVKDNVFLRTVEYVSVH